MKKTCTKCKKSKDANKFSKHPATKDRLQSKCKLCTKEYNAVNADRLKQLHKEYYSEHGDRLKAGAKRRYNTVDGYLHSLFGNMKRRCETLDSYTAKGISNKFDSPNVLIDYVVNILKVDPRGLDCHRIDNNGNYEPGNIEFLTEADHMNKHKRKKRISNRIGSL